MPTRDYPLNLAFQMTPSLELAYTKGHHDPVEFAACVRAVSEGMWSTPQHGWWRWLRGSCASAAAPGTQGAFPVTWMERRR